MMVDTEEINRAATEPAAKSKDDGERLELRLYAATKT
jgi:hypothetical protein